MNILKSLAAWLVVVVVFLAVLIGVNALFDARTVFQQAESDKSVESDLARFYIVKEPMGPDLTEVSPGESIYFTIERKRTVACYVDVDWRWSKVVGVQQIAAWSVNGSRSYTAEGHGIIYDHVQVPTELTPGEYTVQRIADYDCGNGHKLTSVDQLEVTVK